MRQQAETSDSASWILLSGDTPVQQSDDALASQGYLPPTIKWTLAPGLDTPPGGAL